MEVLAFALMTQLFESKLVFIQGNRGFRHDDLKDVCVLCSCVSSFLFEAHIDFVLHLNQSVFQEASGSR
jgi:hypothetical protein